MNHLLDRWLRLVVDPSSGVVFVVTPSGGSSHVQATIPASAADGGGRIFCRLKALSSP